MVRCTRIGPACAAPLLIFALLGSSGESLANGRFPATTSVKFQPGNASRILLPTTFGLLISEDDGTSFRWICEDTIGYGGTFDPDYAIASNGNIYATTFNGLQVSTDGACTFGPTQFFGDLTGNAALDPISGHWVGEIEVASDGKIWAVTSTGGAANDVYVSTDGTTFNSANNWHLTAWWKSLRISESAPDVVYVSGYQIPVDPAPAYALLFKTIDGGANWTDMGVSDFAFGEQPNLLLAGVSPTDPDIVFARVLGARQPQGDDIYRSVDGGASWAKVLEMHGTISAFAIRADGSVYVGTATPCAEDFSEEPDAALPNNGCVRVSTDGAADNWTIPAKQPKLGCIAERAEDNKLFGCAGNWEPDNFALGSSSDKAESWDKVMRFVELTGPLQCPAGTQQNTCEELNWPSLCIMLGICDSPEDAGAGAADGSTTVIDPPDESGCFGCQSSGLGGLSSLFALLALVGLLSRRSARSRQTK